MTDEKKIIEANKLIAEFMGGRYLGKDRIGGHDYDMFDLPESFPITLSTADDFGMKRTGYLGFHKQWDWLMPVIEKISVTTIKGTPPFNSDQFARVEILPHGYVKISDLRTQPIFANVSIEGSLINATYKAVVAFVKWYNSQTTDR